MSASVSIKKTDYSRSRKMIDCNITLDSTYAAGGEAVSEGAFGLVNLDRLIIENPLQGGYLFVWDAASKKIVAYKANQVVTADAVTVSSDVTPAAGATNGLVSLPAAILAVHGTVSSTSTNFNVVAAARTLATGECHVNYDTGVITFFASDDPTAVTVDYISQKLSEVAASTDLSAITLRVIAVGY